MRKFVLLHGAVRSWLWLEFNDYLSEPLLFTTALGLTASALIAFAPAGAAARAAPRVALPFLAVQLVATFPLTDNHFFLETLVVAVLSTVSPSARPRDDDERLALSALRWLTIIVLFHTGLQKVLHGQYFGGEFLAFMVGVGDRFADLFALVVPGTEIERLQSYNPLETGAGPYRVASIPFVALSNLVWIAEMALAVLLIVPRTRTAAAWLTIAMIAAIQLGARELGFGFLFVNLLLLFAPPRVARRALPLFVALYLGALASVAGSLPGGELIRGGNL